MTEPSGGSMDPAATRLTPQTTPEELSRLAAEQPEFWPAIRQHPNAYPDLQRWIADRQQEQAVAAPAPAPAQASPDTVQAGPVQYTSAQSQPQPLSEPVQHAPAQYDPAASGPRSAPVDGAAGKKRRRGPVIAIAVSLAVLLALGGTGAVLASTGSWPFGEGGPLRGVAEFAGIQQEEQKPSFADGIERMWVADSNDYVTPMTGELAQDFSYLKSNFSRASIALFEADTPVATKSAVLFNARSDESKLVMLDATSGEVLLEHDLGGAHANCVADEFVDPGVFYCVQGNDEKGESTLIRIDADGRVDEHDFDLPVKRAAVAKDRIVLAGEQGVALAVDRSYRELWKRTDLGNGSYAGIDLGAEQTLVRGYNGWTLLGADGRTLAEAAVVGPYDGGDGACDARLTASDRLFIASDDDSCSKRTDEVEAWGFGPNLAGKHIFTADGRDYVLDQGEDRTRLMRFPDSGAASRLETVLETDGRSSFIGVTEGKDPLLVLRNHSEATSFSLADGNALTTWSVPEQEFDGVEDPATLGDTGILLDDRAALIGGAAYDVRSGARLWSLDAPQEQLAGWTSAAGLLVLGGGCPECSTAGGAYTSSTLTLYAPLGSGGERVSVGSDAVAGASDPATAIPASIPASCPAGTILLAWAELSDGWLLVCGVDAQTPSYAEVVLAGSSRSVASIGASDPTGAEAKRAVTWDPESERFTIELADRTVLIMDYNLGVSALLSADRTEQLQQSRFVRYVFVPLGEEVRTIADSSSGKGAFGVQKPEGTAEDQVRYMYKVIRKSMKERGSANEAYRTVFFCRGDYSGAASGFAGVRDNRAELLDALQAMPVDKIPHGNELLNRLKNAIRYSYKANIEQVKWAEDAGDYGCRPGRVPGKLDGLAVKSDQWKAKFAKLWNRAIAPKFEVSRVEGGKL